MEYEIKKIKILIDSDLSFVSLFDSINYLSNNFKINPKNIVVTVSIEQLINAIMVKKILQNLESFLGFIKAMIFNPALIKITWGKKIFFSCDRDLEKDYWEVSCFKNNISYKVYSQGT